MEITAGWIMTGVSVLGIIGCLIGLLISGSIFKKQRERLLYEIEKE